MEVMDLNFTTVEPPVENANSLNHYIRLINLCVSCIGVLTNSILLIVLLLLRRHQCTTYFLLIIMTLCDCLYCVVYASILLTIESYVNIINHQILCPLSFFLTPFTFTGSTLLLFVCLLHLITNYARHYDSVLGQIGGRLSVVFIFAFIIIRSVLGSTSINLVADAQSPNVHNCIIDINTNELVTRIQNINHIFAEVTDILVYLGWIVLLVIYLFSSKSSSQRKTIQSVKFLITKSTRQETLLVNTDERLTSKERHRDISVIILVIGFMSITLYLPIIISKFVTLELTYRYKTILSDRQIFVLQIVQQVAHLFCLTIRFVPYVFFDKRIYSYIHQSIGMKIQRKRSSKKRLQKYICHCQCSRRQEPLESL
ncbi:unnamed protein product [Adineta ricciae]|uniref:G-protein coupled receptors family 1 profile domain-containing protein n=2 Tax=Adineta ricciae TaxID=249248 RepID=A0A815MR31_ADIRI|nr:unnamed protein product [Adineta ricciae]